MPRTNRRCTEAGLFPRQPRPFVLTDFVEGFSWRLWIGLDQQYPSVGVPANENQLDQVQAQQLVTPNGFLGR